ncbi:hypothetical protein ACS0TY_019439 [Phlomoides rotata]
MTDKINYLHIFELSNGIYEYCNHIEHFLGIFTRKNDYINRSLHPKFCTNIQCSNSNFKATEIQQKGSLSCNASLAMLLVLAAQLLEARLQSCNPSGKIRGITPPKGQCNQENDSDCYKAGSSTPLTSVLLPFLATRKHISPSTASRRAEMVAVHQNVTISTTLMTHQSWPYVPDGTVEAAGVLKA